MVDLIVAAQQSTGGITDSLLYKLLKDFSLPLLAVIWAVYSYLRQQRRRLSIRQVGDQYSDRIDSPPGLRTRYSVELAITNDSPQAPIVVAYYDIELPWNEPNINPMFDPSELDPPKGFYTVGSFNVQVDREKVLNHQRYRNGRLAPGDVFRGFFLAKGDNPIPEDLKKDASQKEGCDRWIEATFVVQDTTGREYRSPIHLHF
jgi:hypothetical protein